MSDVAAYPLQWPEGWPRTPKHKRTSSAFDPKRTRNAAVDALLHEVYLLGGRRLVLSSMLKLRNDGLPYSQQPKTDDPGIAVYFTFRGRPMALACDQFVKDVDNIWAVKLTIEALRGIERWGASTLMERAFTGFQALPPPNWRRILDLPDSATVSDAEAAYRRLAKQFHPDVEGGDEERFKEITEAIELARKGASA